MKKPQVATSRARSRLGLPTTAAPASSSTFLRLALPFASPRPSGRLFAVVTRDGRTKRLLCGFHRETHLVPALEHGMKHRSHGGRQRPGQLDGREHDDIHQVLRARQRSGRGRRGSAWRRRRLEPEAHERFSVCSIGDFRGECSVSRMEQPRKRAESVNSRRRLTRIPPDRAPVRRAQGSSELRLRHPELAPSLPENDVNGPPRELDHATARDWRMFARASRDAP
jgi:hypothetical protein